MTFDRSNYAPLNNGFDRSKYESANGVSMATATDEDPGIIERFGETLSMGVDKAQGMGGGFLEATGELLGNDYLTDTGRDIRESNDQEIIDSGYEHAMQFTDINSVGDVGSWLVDTVGDMLPMMAPSMAGGLAGAGTGFMVGGPVGATIGGLIGAFVPSEVMGVGEVQANIKEKGGTAPGMAFVGGTAIAALDSILPGKIGGQLAKRFGVEVAEEIAEKTLTKKVKKSYIKEGGLGILTEGLTEALQEAIGEVSAAVGTGTPISDDLGNMMINAGAAGALMGGGASTVSTGVHNLGLKDNETPGHKASAKAKPLTDADRASPIPDELIQAGNEAVAAAEAASKADETLRNADMPATGSTVLVDMGHEDGPETGVITDSFEQLNPETGEMEPGVEITRENGKVIRQAVSVLDSMGVTVTPSEAAVEPSVDAGAVTPEIGENETSASEIGPIEDNSANLDEVIETTYENIQSGVDLSGTDGVDFSAMAKQDLDDGFALEDNAQGIAHEYGPEAAKEYTDAFNAAVESKKPRAPKVQVAGFGINQQQNQILNRAKNMLEKKYPGRVVIANRQLRIAKGTNEENQAAADEVARQTQIKINQAEAARKRGGPKRKVEHTLLGWISRQGGLAGVGSDFVNEFGSWHDDHKGFKPLVRPASEGQQLNLDGQVGVNADIENGIERMFERAVDNGFFPELDGQDIRQLNPEDLLFEKMSNENRGGVGGVKSDEAIADENRDQWESQLFEGESVAEADALDAEIAEIEALVSEYKERYNVWSGQAAEDINVDELLTEEDRNRIDAEINESDDRNAGGRAGPSEAAEGVEAESQDSSQENEAGGRKTDGTESEAGEAESVKPDTRKLILDVKREVNGGTVDVTASMAHKTEDGGFVSFEFKGPTASETGFKSVAGIRFEGDLDIESMLNDVIASNWPDAKPDVRDQEIEDVLKIKEPEKTDKDRLQAKADKPMQGGDEPAGGMFDDNIRDQVDIADVLSQPDKKPSTPTASWVIREKSNGNVIMETFDRKKVDALNTDKYEAVPIKEHLASLNEGKDSSYGANNKYITKDKADELRKQLRAKLNGSQLNSGFDPEIFSLGAQMAAYHIEAGARSFADFAKAMIDDFGENAQPYLKSWYNGARDFPGFDKTGMTPATEIDDVSSTSSSLESDRADAGTRNSLGETDVSDGQRGNVSSTGGRAKSDSELRSGKSSSGELFENDARSVGERGNSGVRPRQPANETSVSGRSGHQGSGDDRLDGLSNDHIPTGTVERFAEPASSVDESVPQDIRDALPKLFPEQQQDVVFAETRFAKEDGHGVMFTNGTGTGKTWTGIGIAKRFVDAGKGNILIVVPNDGIIDQWLDDGGKNGLRISRLKDTKDFGSGVVITTYANMQNNHRLAGREWDLVIADESQNLMENMAGEEKAGLKNFRGLTNNPKRLRQKAKMLEPELLDEINAVERKLNKFPESAKEDDINGVISELEEALSSLRQEMGRRVEERLPEVEKLPRGKVVFLSATPFGYDKTIDYADQYLFDYGPEPESSAYNTPSARNQYMIENFGYSMKYNKLTRPDSAVENELMERNFHERLRNEKVLSGRVLNVDKDYDRKFMLIDDGVGNKIDELLEFLREAHDRKYAKLAELVRKKFDYLARMRLLEAIKAHHAVQAIKDHHAMGRKVLVFHDFNEGGGINPFAFTDDMNVEFMDGDRTIKMRDLYNDFVNERTDALKMDFSEMRSPIETLTEAFPNAGLYNGKVSKKLRAETKRRFNLDSNGINDAVDLMVVQAEAGKAGLSAHDTTGNSQRVLINLGMPVRATTAIQQEGRIYRIGQASDAIFRYMNTGTDWERQTFASKIAERAGTAENLALGNQARALRQAFIDAFSDSDVYPASTEDGQGGKESDRATGDEFTAFDKAKTFYFAQGKKRGRRDQREGVDYFATPEPVGMKMAEFAQLALGEDVLEPSAGHGAIARFFPETANRTLIEPSLTLGSKAELASPGSKLRNEQFEDLHISNKYDGIVMNPPYGSGGKTSTEHLAKAVKHLRNGGRIVALLPKGGMADKRMDQFRESEAAEDIHLIARIDMPSVTFERAGTKVSTAIYVFEKHTDGALLNDIPAAQITDLTSYEKIGELFDAMEHLTVADRTEPETKEVEQAESVRTVENNETLDTNDTLEFDTENSKHTKTGADIFIARAKRRTDNYKAVAALARQNNGMWSRFVKGFLFDKNVDRMNFLSDVGVAQSEGAKFSRREKRIRTIEVSNNDFAGLNTKTKLRAESIKRIRAMRGLVVKNGDTQREIQLTKKGLEHAIHDAGDEKVMAATKLPDLVRVAKLFETLPDKNNDRNVKQVHTFLADVVVNGKQLETRIYVKEKINGDMLHDMSVTSEKKTADEGRQTYKRAPVPISYQRPYDIIPGKAEFDKIQSTLAKRLKALGLSDKIALKFVEVIKTGSGLADGAYAQKLIRVAMDAKDHKRIFDHETIHALRDLGVFRDMEWRQLEKAALADTAMMERVRRENEGANLTESELVEEAIANLFADSAKGQTGGFLARAIKRVMAFFKAVKAAFSEHGYKSVEDIFEGIESGYVGRRDGEAGTGTEKFQRNLGEPYTAGEQEESPADPRAEPSTQGNMLDNTFEGPAKSLVEALGRATQKRMDRIRAAAGYIENVIRLKGQDKFIWLRRTQEAIEKAKGSALTDRENTYQAEELYHSTTAQRIEDFQRNVEEKLVAKIKRLGLSFELVDEYLYARHAKERNAHIRSINPENDSGSGMTDAEADSIMDMVRLNGLSEKFDSVARDIDAITAASIRTRIDAGLLDQKTARRWLDTYQHYVPLRGWEDESMGADIVDSSTRPAIGKGFSIKGAESKRALGRRSRSDSPVLYTLLQAQESIIRAEKNKVAQTFFRMVQENPNTDMWEVSKVEYKPQYNASTGLVELKPDVRYRLRDNVMSVKVNGQEHHITIHHDGLARGMNNLGSSEINKMIRGMQWVQRKLAFVNTSLNPEFIVSNAFRDAETAGINLSEFDMPGLKRSVMRDYRKALAGAYGGLKGKRDTVWQKHFHDFSMAGGKTAFFGLETIEQKAKRLEGIMSQLDPTKLDRVKQAGGAVRDLIQDANGAVENAVRLSAYANVINQFDLNGKSDAEIKAIKSKAASIAKNLTVNFNRKGEWGTQIGAFFLFFNASTQGSFRLLGAMRRSKNVRKVVGGLVLASIAMEFINAALSPEGEDGEDEWDKLSDWEKAHNFIIMNPWAEGDDSPYLAKIPMAYGYNVFGTAGLKIGEAFRGKTDLASAAMDIVVATMGAFNPIGSGHDLVSSITPTWLTPATDIATNKNFMGSPIMPTDSPFQAPTPDSQKHFKGASSASKWITAQLNSMTDGDEIYSGGIDISPETIDHIAGFITGGAGTFAGRAVDTAIKTATGENVRWNDVPILRKFVGGKNSFYDKKRYYEIRDAANLASKAIKSWQDENPDQLEHRENERPAEFSIIFDVKASEKQLRRLRKERKQTTDKARLKEIEKEILAEMQSVNRRFNELQEGQ